MPTFPVFAEFVVQRPDRVHADDLYLRIFLLEETADAADGSAGAHPAHEMRDLPFRILPDFRTRGAVMGLRVHRIFVLVGIKRIGNLFPQLFRHRVVAARIVRLDGRGADNHFGAESLEQVHFFLRLLVRDSEDHLVAAHRRHQRQPQSGIARRAFDDRAAGLEQSFALGFIDHGNADAVLHRTARIQIVGLDVHFGLELSGHAVQPHQRRATNRFENVFALHGVANLVNAAGSVPRAAVPPPRTVAIRLKLKGLKAPLESTLTKKGGGGWGTKARRPQKNSSGGVQCSLTQLATWRRP